MKKITAKAGVALMLLASLTSTSVLAAPVPTTKSINLVINSVPVNTDVKPIIMNGRTLAPIRVISESLGASVNWDKATQKVTITRDSDVIELTINKLQVKVNGVTQVLDQAPILHNSSTMLPLRFIGEALGCTIGWDAKTRTVTVTENNAGGSITKPTANVDRWGRKIRTTNLPKNSSIFPYIVEGVPNWVYEQINMTNTALISQSGVSSNPKQLFNREKSGDGMDYDKMLNILEEYFDKSLNIDYRTINEADFVSYAVRVYHENGYPSFAKNVEDAARQYVKYIKDNKIVVTGEFQLLPEMFWENNLDTHVVSAHVKLTVVQSNSSKGFSSFGDVPTGSIDETPKLVVGKTYEGLVQFRVTDYKIDYNTNNINCQIHPKSNAFGGALKTNNPY